MPARAIQSKYVFSCDEMPKLYSGAAITTMSAASSSAISAALRALMAFCSGVRCFVGREERAERRVVEMRQVVGQQVAHDGLRAGVRLLQL